MMTRKEFAPHGSKYFLLRVDPISEGTCCAGTQTESHQNCLPCKIRCKSTSVANPLNNEKNKDKIAIYCFALLYNQGHYENTPIQIHIENFTSKI